MLALFKRLWAAWRGTPAAAEPTKRDERGLMSTELAPLRSRGEAIAAIINRIKAAQPVLAEGVAMDDFDLQNTTSLAGLQATPLPEVLLSWFGAQSFIGHMLCGILAQHWLIDLVCTLPGRDAIRNGWKSLVSGDADNDDINAIVKAGDLTYRLKPHLLDFVRKGRIFGIRLALYKVDTGDDEAFYENPFNPDAVTPGSYKGIVQIDPQWCAPIFDREAITDPTSPEFYEPTWWQVGQRRIHRSHFAIFRTPQPTDNLKPLYNYGGIPIPQKIMERVYAAERTANEGPQLLMSKRLTVWNTDIAQVMANPSKFAQHMWNFTQLRDNFGVKVNDTDDEMQQFDTALAGIWEMIEGEYDLVAAAGEVPITKILQKSPKGMNGSGEYEAASYREGLESVQEHDLTPLLDGHYLRFARSTPELAGKTIAVEWEDLDAPGAKEKAETRYIEAQTDDLYVAAGALDGQDVRDRLRNDPESGYTNLKAAAPTPAEDPEADPAGGPVKVNPSKALSSSGTP